MAIKICLFNHKGGVSKTTTTYNLGWKIADMGKRVLLVDGDPQCNLTGMFLGSTEEEELEKFYSDQPKNNIYIGLQPAMESRPVAIKALECVQNKYNDRLLLLPGHVGLAEYETTLNIAHELSRNFLSVTNIPGAINNLIIETVEKHSIDYVIIDMSPSVGGLNKNFFCISDYFIVPTAPDFYSAMAIDSLSKILPRWHAWTAEAHQFTIERDAVYLFPNAANKYLGYVIQNYRLRNKIPAPSFQKWIDKIDAKINDVLLKAFGAYDMLMNGDLQARNSCLGQFSGFNSLIAISQECGKPVYALEDALLGSGMILELNQKSRAEFNRLFTEFAERILTKIKAEEHKKEDVRQAV